MLISKVIELNEFTEIAAASTASEMLSLGLRTAAAGIITAYLGRKVFLWTKFAIHRMNLSTPFLKAIDTIMIYTAGIFTGIIGIGSELSLAMGILGWSAKLFENSPPVIVFFGLIGVVVGSRLGICIMTYMETGRIRR